MVGKLFASLEEQHYSFRILGKRVTYTHTHTRVCVCVCIYIYIYICIHAHTFRLQNTHNRRAVALEPKFVVQSSKLTFRQKKRFELGFRAYNQSAKQLSLEQLILEAQLYM